MRCRLQQLIRRLFTGTFVRSVAVYEGLMALTRTLSCTSMESECLCICGMHHRLMAPGPTSAHSHARYLASWSNAAAHVLVCQKLCIGCPQIKEYARRVCQMLPDTR